MIIKITDLCKRFGDKIIFEGYNVDIKKGQMTVIMAPSGKGKTTLLRLIAGLEKLDSGKIVGNSGKKSFVFQEDRLLEHITAYENVAAVHTAREHFTKETVRKDFERLGINVDDTDEVSKYSGGMKRRVALLRALTSEYDILLLDEPFTGLDDALKADIMIFVKEKTVGKTVIMVTHDENETKEMNASILNI